MLCLVRSDAELASYLAYELTAHSPSLFDNVSIHKGTKSSLIHILDEFSPSQKSLPVTAVYTIDGGHLLHKVVLLRPATFSCQQYVKYVKDHYGCCYIVFYGYQAGPSIKDVEHLHRGKNVISVNVNVEDNIHVSTSQDLLTDKNNKAGFIKLLKDLLQKAGCHVYQAAGDADTLIVSKATKLSLSNPSVFVGEDTDLLVLLITHAIADTHMLLPGTKTRPDSIYSSQNMQDSLGEMKKYILFLHAFTECDSISAPFNKGKKNAYKLLFTNDSLRSQMDVFKSSSSSSDSVAAAGETFFLALYGAKSQSNLDTARHHLYIKTVAKQQVSGGFNLATLPPTSSVACQHSLRVYLQVHQWRHVNLPPTKWSWMLYNDMLLPVPRLLKAALNNLMKLVMYNCKISCDNYCECKCSGLECSSMCGQCYGYRCSNRPVMDNNCEFDSEEEDIDKKLNSITHLDNVDN
ncbi:hypothetical protein PR048_023390 [Dryococelus australis]|uniref:Tesmin/TSO1-like CXC domain-containing protein n=1 Tax=Dryococelus australis TaxID=614101 RepID=A0ABQ9GTY2_9NEOP|nr:hypothetical protein PR048_023390 [Dryococelus australis]